MKHTHWLVTKGLRSGASKVTPIVLMPITGSLRDLTDAARAEINRRAALFLPMYPDIIDQMRALTGPYYTKSVDDLWFMEVTPTAHTSDRSLPENIAALEFVLRVHDREAPAWQGPADGVIPAETPRLLYDALHPPAKLTVIEA